MKRIEDLTILFVDDEPEVLRSLKRFLLKADFRTIFAGSGREALALAASEPVDILVTDLRMPEMDGLTLIGEFKRLFPDCLRLILSATRNIDQTIESINSGEVFRFIPKPLEPETFKTILADAADYCLLKADREEMLVRLEEQNRQLAETNEQLKKSEASLRASEGNLRSLTTMAYDAIIALSGYQITFWNRGAEQLFGYRADEVVGADAFEMLFSPSDRRDFKLRMTRILRDFSSGETIESEQIGESTGICKNGSEVVFEFSAAPATINDTPQIIIVARDISHRLEAEQTRQHIEEMQRSIERRIERALLQSRPPAGIEGAEIGSVSIPSGHLDGDFTDFIVNDSHHFDLLIADVMGKGVKAALTGAGIKATMLKILAQHDCRVTPRHDCPRTDVELTSLGQTIDTLNAMTVANLIELEMLVTLSYSRFDLEKAEMAYVSCGHTWTLHFQAATGACHFLEGLDLPLGVQEGSRHRATVVPFASGDIFLFYSDGITEAENPEEEQFGTSRMAELVKQHHQQEPEEMITRLRQEVLTFSGKEQFDDDFTCIVVKITAPPSISGLR